MRRLESEGTTEGPADDAAASENPGITRRAVVAAGLAGLGALMLSRVRSSSGARGEFPDDPKPPENPNEAEDDESVINFGRMTREEAEKLAKENTR